MNNEPVAYFVKDKQGWWAETDKETGIPFYTHPVKDREADRLRFSDEPFNRWLDESISDSGHTVYDLVENVCEAWHGWENSQYYTHPVKELHLSFQKSKQTGELLAVTYTDDEHRIVEVLWQRPPELTDEEILEVWRENERVYPLDRSRLLDRTRACIRKASEK